MFSKSIKFIGKNDSWLRKNKRAKCNAIHNWMVHFAKNEYHSLLSFSSLPKILFKKLKTYLFDAVNCTTESQTTEITQQYEDYWFLLKITRIGDWTENFYLIVSRFSHNAFSFCSFIVQNTNVYLLNFRYGTKIRFVDYSRFVFMLWAIYFV